MLVTISTLVVDVNDEEPPLGQSSKTGIGGKVPKSFHELDSAGTRVERLEHIVICGNPNVAELRKSCPLAD